MKTSAIKTIALGCLGGALGTLLPSCVESYTQDYGSPYGATAYRPGYEVRVLPPDYRTEVINGSTYYHHGGVYYRPRAGGYVIVDPPHSRYGSHRRGYDSYSRRDLPSDGAVVPRLPSGSRMIDTRNGRYYQYNDTYYQQRGSGYAIVGRPY
jgi:hypothetical protein